MEGFEKKERRCKMEGFEKKEIQPDEMSPHIRELSDWTPPSLKKLDLPVIEIPETNAVDSYHYWLNDHPEVSRLVPPIYKDFCIKFRKSFEYPDSDPVCHDYVDIIHYTDDLCAFAVCHIIDGKKKFVAMCDYDQIDGLDIHIVASIPKTTTMSDSFMQTEPTSAALLPIALQNFLLLHKPEIVPVYVDHPSGKQRKPANAQKKSDAPRKKVADTVKRYIRLDGKIPAVRTYHYSKLQWQVRGHYRHTTHGKKPCVIYIAPHYAKRGDAERKVRQPVTEITANPMKKSQEELI